MPRSARLEARPAKAAVTGWRKGAGELALSEGTAAVLDLKDFINCVVAYLKFSLLQVLCNSLFLLNLGILDDSWW